MAFQAYSTAIPGSMLTAAFWNQQVRDNGIDMYGGGMQIPSQDTNDVPYAASATQLGRFPFTDPNTLIQGGPAPSGVRGIGTQTIWLPARSWSPTPDATNRPAPFVDIATGAWGPIYAQPQRKGYWDVSIATLSMPKQWDRGALTGRIYWTTNDANSGTVHWYVHVVQCYADGENYDTWSGYGVGDGMDSALGDKLLHISPAFTITVGYPADQKMLRMNLCRYQDGNDTYPTTAYFLGLLIEYNCTALVDN